MTGPVIPPEPLAPSRSRASTSESLSLEVPGSGAVSALAMVPDRARAAFVLAHGAGAGMRHPFMGAVADGLARRGIATLRYQFPSMERGTRRPDPPRVAHAAVRAAVAVANARWPDLPLVAGGKSFGARMTSQVQAEAPLARVLGLVFLGFPLHPADRPGEQRGEHLADVTCPMLFVQGTRDALAEIDRVAALTGRLGSRATLATIEGADHAFHVPARSGRTDGEVLEELFDTTAAWIAALAPGAESR